jgi:YVTN family beta-propeller protein
MRRRIERIAEETLAFELPRHLDTASHEIVANVVVGNRPRRFAATPDGAEVWVSNELGGSVSILDGATHEVKGTVTFEPRGFRADEVTPVGITMTRDGKTAYVTLGRANHCAVVDVASRTVRDYVLAGSRAWGATLKRGETLLFVANGLSDDVSIVDTRTNKVLRSVPVGRVPHTVVIDD